MKIEAGSKLVMIGDSITDAGRSEAGEATPWDSQGGFGHGYVNLVNALITATCPAENIRIVNRGIGGDTVLALKDRWEKDVLDLKPDWLSVMIGINDVWRQFDVPLQTNTHVTIDRYEKIYDELLTKTRPTIKGLVLITPYIIDANRDDKMRKMMNEYGEVVRKLAEKHDAIFVDTQAAMDKLIDVRYHGSIAWDRIHPNTSGHMVLMRAFLDAIEFKW